MNFTKDQANRVIQSLRVGVAPDEMNHFLSCGRDHHLEEFKRCYANTAKGYGTVKVVTGPYGIGKSFFVNQLKQQALNDDFVISSFQVNQSFRMNKLQDLYYTVMHNLSIKGEYGSRVGFDNIFDLWIENLQNSKIPNQTRFEINNVCQELATFNHTYARAFLGFMRGRIQHQKEMLQVTSAWLTGEPNIPYQLKKKYELVGSIDQQSTLDFLKAFSKLIDLLGYKGLVIFIDELDQLVDMRSDLRQQSYQNIKHLIDMTNTGQMHKIMFVLSGANDLIEDNDKGLYSLKPLKQRLGTPTVDEDVMKTIHYLEPLKQNHRLRLTEKIMYLYSQSTTLDLVIDSRTLMQRIDSDVDSELTRDYIMKVIHSLDGIAKDGKKHPYNQ